MCECEEFSLVEEREVKRSEGWVVSESRFGPSSIPEPDQM
jgi:hypothetical protein